MKAAALVLIGLLSAGSLSAQEETLTLDDLVDSAQEWAKDNLDDRVLRVLQSADQEKVKRLFAELQKQFQGEYVIQLAPLRESAQAMLPLLERYEETEPYAVWLKARLDYLEVAEEFRLTIPPPKEVPGLLPKPLPNPPPEKEREIWIKKLAERPLPETAKPYVPRLKPIFTAQKVPAELVWLAEVESSFDPRARSPAGATGLFQLMPSTAKRYGLRLWPLDERTDAEESARAAARYLEFLHRHYHDWRLALAAYNAGEGTVDKLLARHKAQSFDGIAPYLPAETQLYVPKVEGVLLRREGVNLATL